MTLQEALADWMRRSSSDDAERTSLIENVVLQSAATAGAAEALDALEVLWPLTRSLTRQACWELMPRDAVDERVVRPEIRRHLRRAEDHAQTIEMARGAWEEERRARRAYERTLSESARTVRDLLGAGPERHLPPARASALPAPTPPDTAERFRRDFPFLARLAQALAPTVGTEVVFVAVLGPVQDALSWRDPEGTAAEIDLARLTLLGDHVRTGKADLRDTWQWFRRTMSPDAERAFVEAAERAPFAELEMFFDWWIYDEDDTTDDEGDDEDSEELDAGEDTDADDETDQDDDGSVEIIPELLLADPERLWLRLLRRPGISLELLDRAGEFFWEFSAHGRGPADALTALAVRWELDVDEVGDAWVLFWKAFEDAAESGRWAFAIANLDLAFWQLGAMARIDPAAVGEQLEERRPDLEHVAEGCRRSIEARPGSRRFLLWWAWSGMDRSGLRDSALGRTLRRAVQAGHLAAAGPPDELPEKLGSALWERLDDETRLLLEQADALWTASELGILDGGDYGLVGAHVRRAIAHEWRVRLRGIAGVSGEELNDMIQALLDMGPAEWSTIRERWDTGSRLRDRAFLRSAQAFWSEWLDPPVRGEGNGRPRGQAFREQLWDRGWLKDLLGAVQLRPDG
jgi:hypothetical protein